MASRIKSQINRLNRITRKSPGENGIKGKLLKLTHEVMVENTYKLIEMILKKEIQEILEE